MTEAEQNSAEELLPMLPIDWGAVSNTSVTLTNRGMTCTKPKEIWRLPCLKQEAIRIIHDFFTTILTIRSLKIENYH